jgi:hypothetical protein
MFIHTFFLFWRKSQRDLRVVGQNKIHSPKKHQSISSLIESPCRNLTRTAFLIARVSLSKQSRLAAFNLKHGRGEPQDIVYRFWYSTGTGILCNIVARRLLISFCTNLAIETLN